MRVHFHLHKDNGVVRLDDEGADYPDLETAYLTAVREIPEIVAEYLRQRADPMNYFFRVVDENGCVLTDISFREALKGPRAGTCVQTPIPRSLGAEGVRPADCELASSAFQAAFGAAPTPHVMLTPDARVMAFNEAWSNMLPAKCGDVRNRNLFELFPERNSITNALSRQRYLSSIERVFLTGMADTIACQRYDFRDPSGQWKEAMWSVENWPFLREDGTICGIVNTVRLLDKTAALEPAA